MRYVELQEVNLWDVNFQGAYLWNAELREADLRLANLQGAYLRGAELREADLRFANLQGVNLFYSNLEKTNLIKADLKVTFLYATRLRNAEGLQYTKISNKYIEEIMGDNLHKILNTNNEYEAALKRFLYLPLKGLKLKENEVAQFISKTKIYLMTSSSNSKETLYTLKELYNKKGNIPKSEIFQYRFDLYEHSRDVYVSLKNYFKNIGWYDKSGTYFIGEYRMKGKINKLSGDMAFYELFKRISQFFNKLTFWRRRKEPESIHQKASSQESKNSWILLGNILTNYFLFSMNRVLFITSLYGESVWRVFFTAFSIILIYASIYSLSDSIIGIETAVPVHSFWTNLYFSIVTFTTLGYGDLHPVSSIGIRLLAGSEAFLGAFILAYFVVVVSRKIMR